MTEEIIKECKNCDALGIDSEIGVYYCCLSHRQDDLPKEFTCNDFTPNKQLKRLEQENRALRKANEISIEKVTVTAEAKRLKELEQENKELKEKIKKYSAINEQDTKDYAILRNALEEIRILATKNVSIENFVKIQNKINEVLNDN